MTISIDEAKAILADDENDEFTYGVDGAFEGLILLKKAHPEGDVITCAEHDQIWSFELEETLPKLSRDELIRLRELNWFLDDDAWSYFV